MYLTIEPPGGSRRDASKESVSGTSKVIRLPLIAAILRSVRIRVPTLIQVWGAPLRVSVSMPMKCTQAWVTGRLIKMVAPTLKPDASLTSNEAAPDGTYESVIEAVLPAVCHEPAP